MLFLQQKKERRILLFYSIEDRKMPTVTLIIPIYNAENYLRRCLTSAMEQTYQDMEILLMNDGSTDSSLEICREYERMDSRFCIVDKKNTGVSDTRNQAITLSKGEYLQFLDSDDWLSPDATETFVYFALKHNCDLVIADFYRVDGAVFTEKQHIRERGLLTREQFAEYMMENPADFYYGVLWNKLFRKSIIVQHQLLMDTELSWCEDFLFNLSYIRHAERFTAIQTPIYYYMKRKGSLANTDWKKGSVVKFKFRLLEVYKDLYQSMGLYEENKMQINAFVVAFAKDGSVAGFLSKKRKKLDEEDYIEEVPAGYTRVKHTFEPVFDERSRILIFRKLSFRQITGGEFLLRTCAEPFLAIAFPSDKGSRAGNDRGEKSSAAKASNCHLGRCSRLRYQGLERQQHPQCHSDRFK